MPQHLQMTAFTPLLTYLMHHRALLKTHHLTSRSKLSLVTNSASHLSLSLVLKTGRSPGILIAEGADREGLKGWVQGVKVGFMRRRR
jgi:hypothetical protein